MSKPHFLELDADNAENPNAPYAVLPIPYERSTSFGKGAAEAPAAILNASEHIELFDEELRDEPRLRVQTLSVPDCAAGTEQEALDAIFAAATKAFAGRTRFLMGLGGEHTISAPLVAASRAVHGEISVLNLDSHLDLRKSYQGNPLSHACVMRRIMESGVPVIHAGIRSLCREEYELVISQQIKVFWAERIAASSDDSWMDQIIEGLGSKVYVSIDADCLDPSVMLGTGTPEPGGLSWRQMTKLLRKVCAAKTVVSADLVEVSPIAGSVASEYAAARLTAKLMAYHSITAK